MGTLTIERFRPGSVSPLPQILSPLPAHLENQLILLHSFSIPARILPCLAAATLARTRSPARLATIAPVSAGARPALMPLSQANTCVSSIPPLSASASRTLALVHAPTVVTNALLIALLPLKAL